MRRQSTATTGEQDRLAKLSWSALRRLLALAAPHKTKLILAGLLALISSGVSLSFPLVARAAVNRVVETRSAQTLDHLVLLFGALVLISWSLMYVQFLLVAYTGNKIVNDLRLSVFSHLQRLPVAFFDRTRSGDLTSHLSNDVGLLQNTITDDLVRLASNVLFFVGGVIEVFIIDWRLTSIVFALMIVIMAGFVYFGRKLRKITRAGLDALADAMGTMSEALANARLVKAFAREEHEIERADAKLSAVLRINMRSSVWEGMMGSVASGGFMFVLLGVLWYGGHGVLSGSLTMGDLIAFAMTLMIVSGPMSALASLYTRLQRAIGAGDRIFAILDDSPEEPDAPNAIPWPEGPGEVQYRDVDFRYVTDTPVLISLNLVVPAGRATAIVGPSGAGKSTLASLLYRFYEPQAGSILVDGQPIRGIRREELRRNIGLVPQDPILFNGTIRENIRYGRLEATDAEVEAAAREANVEEFVGTFPEGYQTMIGERGITLSGGQRQRVAIARAVLKDPSILVLDEATSALDTRSESLVREALERLMKGRTTLIIAHRLSTVQNADQIAVVDDGRIVESGTHRELLARGGRYAALHELLPVA